MTNPTLNEAQEYLTVAYEDRQKRIVDLRRLIRIHPPEVIVALLRTLLTEKKKSLKYALVRDKSDPEINEIVSTIFRIHMAIKSIEEEVIDKYEFERGTGEGGRVSARDLCSDSMPRERENKDNDGEDRTVGQGA